ncbi:MAG: Rieske (2Fe-2S) protein [Isosphaeraceae bacterium]|nr:Rieske (2Fe-2S) protein [Isosphaeraceae bacterium]
MPIYHEICGIEELDEGKGRAFEVDGVAVALYRVAETVHALSGRCPHAAGAMGRGWLEEGEAVCPLHRWRFRLTTGRCTTMPGERISVYPCEIRDGRVWVGL